MTDNYDPFRVDVTFERLNELLQRPEDYNLDFKRSQDFDHPSIVEFTKDAGAFFDRGGYIVVGTDEGGVPTNSIASSEQESKFDEAKLRDILKKYVPSGFRVVSAVHELDGFKVALIQLMPHPDGCCVFLADGSYQKRGGREQKVFREGEIFVRQGTQSRRANSRDMDRILDKRAVLKAGRDDAARLARGMARDVARRAEMQWIEGRRKGAKSSERMRATFGFAMAVKPFDIHERLFFDNSMRQGLSWSMEEKWLRRDGHYFERLEEIYETDDFILSGRISHYGEADALIMVQVSAQGGVAIHVEVGVAFDLDEAVAWWLIGAWFTATSMLTALGCQGDVFSCHLLQGKEVPLSVNSLDIADPRTVSRNGKVRTAAGMAAREVRWQLTNILERPLMMDHKTDGWPVFDVRDSLAQGRSH